MSLIGSLFFYIFQQPIFNLLMAIYAVIHSFWLAIVIMTLLLRSAMVPLVFRQLRSSKVMQQIQPEVQEIQRKYRSEPLVMQQQLSALYKSYNYNPYASCLPLLVQLPFLYGLYGAFNTILRDPHVTAAKLNAQLYPFVRTIFYGPSGLNHLPNTAFLAINLAQPDPTHILPILAALLTLIQTRMSLMRNRNAPRTSGSPDPSAATMQMMQIIMPIFTLFIGWTFPAGLALYWIVTTLYSVVQQYFFNGRNWGGLFAGIPGLERFLPQTPASALATSAGVVDSTLTSPNGRRTSRTSVKEEPAESPAKSGAPKALPPAKTNGATNGDTRSDGTLAAPKTPTKPLKPTAVKTTSTPSRPVSAKKDAVKLVPQASNGSAAATNGHAGRVVAPRATTRPVTTRPPAGTSKPKTSPSARPRKKK